MHEGVVIDLRNGGHVMFIRPDSDVNIRRDPNTQQTFVYDDTKKIFNLDTIDCVGFHMINKQKCYEEVNND